MHPADGNAQQAGPQALTLHVMALPNSFEKGAW